MFYINTFFILSLSLILLFSIVSRFTLFFNYFLNYLWLLRVRDRKLYFDFGLFFVKCFGFSNLHIPNFFLIFRIDWLIKHIGTRLNQTDNHTISIRLIIWFFFLVYFGNKKLAIGFINFDFILLFNYRFFIEK